MQDHTPQLTQLQFDFTPQTREIPLTQGKVAIVDAADYEWLSQWKWFAVYSGGVWYARRNTRLPNGKQRVLPMHRVIMNVADPSIHVDHADGNGLNNTRRNLRLADRLGNARNQRRPRNNTTGYKGVSPRSDKRKRKLKWRARINVNNKLVQLGYYDTPEDAARAYDAAALKYHGEFARLNFG